MYVLIMGCGRVGARLANLLADANHQVTILDVNSKSFRRLGPEFRGTTMIGNGIDVDVLRRAGIERARALVAALNADADNVYVTLSARRLHPSLFIVARARVETAEVLLIQAGADRVVNPQGIGGARMAAFVLQPHVAEFLDIVMHDGSLEFRLEEVPVPAGSPLAGCSLRDAHIRDRTGALILALRDSAGSFTTNPPPETVLEAGQILIAIGTEGQLKALTSATRGGNGRSG